MKIDFRKFKKVAHNDDFTTMQHQDGHLIQIAHKKLTPKLKDQLMSLPSVNQPAPDVKPVKLKDGGDVKEEAKDSPPYNKKAAEELEKGAKKSGYDPQSWVNNVKEGLGLADGGEVEPVSAEEAQAQGLPTDKPLDISRVPASEMPLDVSPASDAEMQAPAALMSQPTDEQVGLAAQKIAAPAPQQQMAAPQAPVAPQVPTLEQGYQRELAGVNQMSQAEGLMGQKQAAILDHDIKQQQSLKLEFKKNFDRLNEERGNFIKDIQNNHIDPKNYWKDHSKIATAIGIIIAGFNPTGRPNAAIEMLNRQMDQNLQAQAQNLNSKNNLLAANMHQFGNLNDAMKMTKVMQSDMVANQLRAEAARATDPMAKARALEAAGKIEREYSPLFMQLNVKRALLDAANNNQSGGGSQHNPDQLMQYLRIMDPAQAKEMESRYVPTLGFASVPLPEKTRDEVVARQGLQEQIHNLRQWAKAHTGSLNPEEVNYGKALSNSVQDAYRRANGQGVFREAESNFVKGIVAEDPTAFLNKFRVDPKYKALEDSNMMQLNSVKKLHGLPVGSKADSLAPNEQALVRWAHANPNDERSAHILQKFGVE